MSHKNAIVTGATRGIGRAIVQLFAMRGINVWACGSKENPDFEQEMRELSGQYGVWITPVYFDLRREESVKAAVQGIIREKKSIDILVNNAGVPTGGTMFMTSLQTLRDVMEVNFIAQIQVMQLVTRVMMRQKKGVVVNMGSVGGIEAREGYLAYGSSKTALMWATRSISKELAPYNIRVNAVAPGLVETDMGAYKKEEERNKILDAVSMKRMGRPEEIAEVVYFLASEESSFITGSIVNADGGRLI